MAQLRAELSPPREPGAFLAYTDGACFGNPDGPGGWSAVVTPVSADEPRWELWGHLTSTSNNRAEALGVLAVLSWTPPSSYLIIRSDSELTVNILKGVYKAKANADLWSAIRQTIADKRVVVSAEWVRGHAGDPGNERADQLSVLGAANGNVDLWEKMLAGASRANSTPRKPPRPQGVPEELHGLEPRGSWESSFVQSVAKQLRAGRPLSEKQATVLARIRARGSAED
jgi:ribonuclease HI